MWCIFATTNKLGINPVGKTENINKKILWPEIPKKTTKYIQIYQS